MGETLFRLETEKNSKAFRPISELKNSTIFRGKNMTEAIISAISLLDGEDGQNFKREWTELSRYLTRKETRVAVLGPFNQGKSTLLNALLGGRHLPVDIVPTTGAAIYIRYGERLETSIDLRDGRILRQSGCKLLERFAVLDERRRMRDDIRRVEIFCPHPLLKQNVTLVDLPGTNDCAEQNALVKSELFSADAVVQVLNARQLFTMDEENKLREWVIESGVRHVIFVLNFSQLLEPDERRAALERAQTIVKGCLGSLSPHSRLYRVDALPALRSQVSGDALGLMQSGLLDFAAGLQELIREIRQNRRLPLDHRSHRQRVFAVKLLASLRERQRRELSELSEAERQRCAMDEAKKQKLLAVQNKIARQARNLRGEFNQSNLMTKHGDSLKAALGANCYENWRANYFQPFIDSRIDAINHYLTEAKGFQRDGSAKSFLFKVQLPPAPVTETVLPVKTSIANDSSGDVGGAEAVGAIAGAAIGTAVFPIFGTAVGAFLGGLFGAAVSSSPGSSSSSAERASEAENRRRAALEQSALKYFEALQQSVEKTTNEAECFIRQILFFDPTVPLPAEKRLRENNEKIDWAIKRLVSAVKKPDYADV
jgi:ribosome biogenesis GTPase A